MSKFIKLNLELEKLTDELLEELAIKVEETIVKLLSKRLGRRIDDFNIIVNIEKEDIVTLTISLEVTGRSRGRINYETVVEEALNTAYKLFEKELRRFVKGSSKAERSNKQH